MIMKNSIIWDVAACSRIEVNQRFGGIYCLHLQEGGRHHWLLVCLPLAFAVESVFFSRISLNVYRSTRRHILEGSKAR
jgi:hypothetical protein